MNDYDYNNYNSPGPGPRSPGPGPAHRPPKQDDWVDVASWVVDVGLIFAIWPVGVALTVAKTRGHDVIGDLLRSLLSRNGQRTQSAQPPQYSRTTSSRVGAQPQQQARANPTYTPGAAAPNTDAKAEKRVRRADTGAKAREVFGWILGVFGAFMTLGAILSADTIWAVLSCLAMIAGGGLLIFSGRQAKKKEAAFRRCMTVSGDKGVVKLRPLAKTLGMTEEELEKQLTEMVDRGYYGERAYIDHARELLVIEPEFMRDVYRAEDEAKAREAAAKTQAEEQAAKEQMTEYERIIERIRQADIDIEDEVMSEKIRQMQAITQAIFSEVELHPEKRPQIDRFMSYYLPTTLKLLESYARIEEQGVSGENTAKAKADIERIADTLVEGYRKQLDTLYHAEAVDIAGDVAVVESMLRRDGLTGDSDFRPFRQFVEPEAKTQEQQGEVLGGH